MRISDCSSDVCSSDLALRLDHQPVDALKRAGDLAERGIVEALKIFRHVLQHGRLVLKRLDLVVDLLQRAGGLQDRKSTRLNQSLMRISYAVFCLKKKKKQKKK